MILFSFLFFFSSKQTEFVEESRFIQNVSCIIKTEQKKQSCNIVFPSYVFKGIFCSFDSTLESILEAFELLYLRARIIKATISRSIRMAYNRNSYDCLSLKSSISDSARIMTIKLPTPAVNTQIDVTTDFMLFGACSQDRH